MLAAEKLAEEHGSTSNTFHLSYNNRRRWGLGHGVAESRRHRCRIGSGSKIAARADENVWQYSTITALMAGAYDGDLTAGSLKHHGDFGLGTFNALDGEMIALDRQVWQVPASRRPALVDRL
jgi:hypothetical protein